MWFTYLILVKLKLFITLYKIFSNFDLNIADSINLIVLLQALFKDKSSLDGNE